MDTVGSKGDREEEEARLIERLRGELPALEKVLAECSDHWGYEDAIYRFYHHSFKVYGLQQQTQVIVDGLQALAPHLPVNESLRTIVAEGTGKKWLPEHNERWLAETRPLVEAFFHARYFLEMACRYGRVLAEPPEVLPSGWAAFLYFYNLR